MRARFSRTSHLALAVTAVSVAAACSSGGSHGTNASPGGGGSGQAGLTKVSLNVAWIPSANQTQFYWALDQGYYKAAGLDVSITNSTGSGLVVQQLTAGKYDIGQADIGTMIKADPAAGLEAFMSQVTKGTFGVEIANGEGTAWKDLYGKTVLVSPGSPETYMLPAVFGKLGLDLGKVSVVNVSASAKTANYIAKRAQAMGGGLPGSISTVDPKRPSQHLYFSDVINTMDLGLIAKSSYIRAHPNVIKAFVQATSKAITELVADRTLAHKAIDQMVADHPNTGLESQRAAFYVAWDNYAQVMGAMSGKPLGYIDPTRLQNTIQALKQYSGFKGQVTPDQLYTNEFVTGK